MRHLFILLFIFTFRILAAQILTVDNANVNSDSSNFIAGSISFKFNINNQSSKKEEEIIFKGLDSKADMIYVGKQHAYIFINKLNYFSSTGGPFVSTGYSHFRINWYRKNKVSYETFTQAQYDEGRNMPLRWLGGAGLRLNLIDNEKGHLYIGTGAMYELERWGTPDFKGDVFTKEILKTTNYLRAKINFNSKATLNFITYYQGGRDIQENIWRDRLINNTHFSAKITNVLSFIASFNLQYDFAPIIPIKKYSYSLTNGIQLNF